MDVSILVYNLFDNFTSIKIQLQTKLTFYNYFWLGYIKILLKGPAGVFYSLFISFIPYVNLFYMSLRVSLINNIIIMFYNSIKKDNYDKK